MATCKDCKFYGVCIMNRRQADADASSCKVYEAGMVFEERDLVEVVRCKDCDKSKRSHLFGSGWRFCMNNSQHHKDEHFCSYGERREGE